MTPARTPAAVWRWTISRGVRTAHLTAGGGSTLTACYTEAQAPRLLASASDRRCPRCRRAEDAGDYPQPSSTRRRAAAPDRKVGRPDLAVLPGGKP